MDKYRKINIIKKIIGCIVFLSVLMFVLVHLTYLMRSHTYGYDDRISIVGLKEEPKDSIDVIYIGGSAAFVYWEPYKAYKDEGFTSYDLANNTIQAESVLTYLKYSQKYQHPDLYIIGLRSFQYYSEEPDETGLRLTSDSLDLGINRFSLIHEYVQNRNPALDELALQLDLINYHTNYDALSNNVAWGLIDNRMDCSYRGCRIQQMWEELDEPVEFASNERADLIPNDIKVMNEILDYCDTEGLNVLFVVCPYAITREEYEIYNSLGDIIVSRGYDYLNTNDFYSEIGIDFSTDFYNKDHVNALGAEKYTVFLEQYLVEHYDLTDHRGQSGYEEWDSACELFQGQSEALKSIVLSGIESGE